MPPDNPAGQPAAVQRLLPQFRLVWSFVAVTAAALLLTLVRWAGEERALLWAIVMTLLWVAMVFASFKLLFVITYFLGLLETLLAPPEVEVLSPFAQDRLPEQVVSPLHVDDK